MTTKLETIVVGPLVEELFLRLSLVKREFCLQIDYYKGGFLFTNMPRVIQEQR